uniref:Peptidase M3A/M3B catalytic domain-containing protein n=2 Tax=Tetranychus urticae TaxID=32264 RepID=T1JSW1_TETUR
MRTVYNVPTRHLAWFKSKSSETNKALSTRIQVVFAPEILPDESSDNSALILPKGELETIPFNDITPIQSLRAFIKNVTLFDTALERLYNESDKLTSQQIFEEIDFHLASLKYSLNLAHVLTYAYPSDYKFGVLDDMYNSFLKHEVSRFNPLSYQSACDIIETTRGSTSDNDLKQLAQHYRAHGKLYGLHLRPSVQEEVADNYRNIKKHVDSYIRNVKMCINREAVLVSDENVIKALPDNFAANSFTKVGIKVPLHPTAYDIFMTHCPDKMLRRQFWAAYNSKPRMGGSVNNSVDFENIRDYRHKLANTLGHYNYAEMIVGRKMAGSVAVAKNMIDSIHEKIKPKYNEDLQELNDSKSHKSIGKVELWDLKYLKAITQKAKFGGKIDVSRYFPMEKAVSGAFKLVENLLGLHIEQVQSDKVQTWSPDVKFYRLLDSDGQVLGHFYLDPYNQKSNNQFGSNIIELTNRTKTLGTTPLCAAFLSKKPPIVKEQQILLSYPEFLSFLSMIGRIITILISRQNYYELSSIYYVSKDRLDSLGLVLLLYGLHNYKAVQLCSANITNGEPLPEQTHQLLRQYILDHESIGLTEDLFLSSLDLAFYTNTEFWGDILQEIWPRYMAPFDLIKEYAYPLSCIEMVSNDGAACHYSKIWSQMIASDICSRFLECGSEAETKEVGKNLRNTFLSSNSSSLSADLFRQFRGRDPSFQPLLDLYNLSTQPKLA